LLHPGLVVTLQIGQRRVARAQLQPEQWSRRKFMQKRYVLALDQGTTSSRAIVFDHAGSIVAVAQREFRQYFPDDGWVEHDPQEIWQSQFAVLAEALAACGSDGGDIAAIGITNQRETTVVWDRATGKPVCNAIVWQDRRTADYCDQLRADGLAETIRAKTGLVIDSYFSGTKLRWILDNVPGVRQRAEQGKLAFGTIDSWLVWNLTGGRVHVTDASNASRTMLYNIRERRWDEDLLRLMNIPHSLLPQVKSSSEIYASARLPGLAHEIPIAGIAGDQQAALFGQMCLHPGMLKNTYGTGSFIMFNTGEQPVQSRNELLTTVAWDRGGKFNYALEGSIFIAGAVVQWLRDGLGVIKTSADVERLALSESDNGGVYLVPAFSGLGAPHWDQRARGSLFGLTRGTSAGHIARAALEGIAFQVSDVLKAMAADSGIEIAELRVDGGATANDTLMQFQADILQIPIVRPKVSETTALGAAYLAGLATGFWSDTDAISQQWQEDRRFEPRMSADQVNTRLQKWQLAVDKAKAWAD
jgi:glycerol kinase